MYKNQFRNTAILGSSLLLSMVIFVPEPSWANCRNSGGGNSGFAYGSQVDGESVTICASSESLIPARKSVVKTPVKSSTKTSTSVTTRTPARIKTVETKAVAAKKVTLPKSLRPATTAPKKLLPFQIAKPAAKAKLKSVTTPATTKTVTKIKVVKGTAAKVASSVVPSAIANQNEAAAFSPIAMSASVSPGNQVEPQTPLLFNSDALAHFRVGKILGKSAEVKFTPVSMGWNFDDGSTGQGLSVQHAFASEGNYQVSARVVYAVSYRFIGQASWVAEPGTIAMIARLSIQVSAEAGGGGNVGGPITADDVAPTGGGRVALVGADCIQRPGSFGCN